MASAPCWGAIQVPRKMEMSKMIVIGYWDWFGTPEEFEEHQTAWKKAAKEVPGIKSTKLYSPHQARYHYAWITEADSYDSVLKALAKMPKRDRNSLTHQVAEIFTETLF